VSEGGRSGGLLDLDALAARLAPTVPGAPVPPVPEHVPEAAGERLLRGLTYCKRCGLLVASDSRPDLDPNRKPCRVVRVGPRAPSAASE
jgi:hypothetical protein